MISPNTITIPISASRFPAAAIGPGVGGTNVWVAYNPEERATAMVAMEMFAFFASVLLSDERITNPLSQKTETDTTAPVIDIARADFDFPISARTVFAMVSVAFDFSSMVPIIVPAMMTIPMYPRMPPNPLVIVFITASGSIPDRIPVPNDASRSTRNAFIFTFAVMTMINAIDSMKMKSKRGPWIIMCDISEKRLV